MHSIENLLGEFGKGIDGQGARERHQVESGFSHGRET